MYIKKFILDKLMMMYIFWKMILKMFNNYIKFKHINVNCKIIYYPLLINLDIHKNYYNVY